MSLQADRRRMHIGLFVVGALCLTFAGCFVVSRSNAPSSTVLIPATPSTPTATPATGNNARDSQPAPAAPPVPDVEDGPAR